MLMYFTFIPDILRLLPIFLALRGFMLLCLPEKRCRTNWLHEAGVVVFWLYLAAVCYITVNIIRILHGNFEMGSNYNLVPFAEIRGIAASADRMYALLNIVGNVVMFAPLGFLLPLLWRGWWGVRVVSASALLSCGIEALQLFTGRGADVDDVLLNTLGGVTGYVCFLIVKAALPAFTGRCRTLTRRHSAPGTGGQANAFPQTSPSPQRGIRRQPKQGRRRRRAATTATVVSLCVMVCGAVPLSGLMRPSVPARSALHPAFQIPALNSANILLVADGRVLYEQGADQRIYPASMTKIMTAVLVLEQMDDLRQLVYLPVDIFQDIYNANLSTAGFLPGEEAPAADLLYGLMLPSGSECAVGLAEHIAGSETAFAELMNGKARELGMRDTHFTNATGNHNRNHYTTAADIALLMRYALENPTFRRIVSTQRYSTSPTALHPGGITFYSTLLGGMADTTLPAGAPLGGKTGYTDEAGQCLASFAQIGGQEVILVTAGARPEDYRAEQLHIADALAVYAALTESKSAL